jgi:hypothetical protein
MTLQSLINKRGLELEIFRNVAHALQHEYLKYQNFRICIPLEIAEDGLTSALSIDLYENTREGVEKLKTYFFGGPFRKVCFVIIFYRDRYDVTLFGRFHLRCAYVLQHEGIKHFHQGGGTVDNSKLEPLIVPDWVAEALNDIASELKKAG